MNLLYQLRSPYSSLHLLFLMDPSPRTHFYHSFFAFCVVESSGDRTRNFVLNLFCTLSHIGYHIIAIMEQSAEGKSGSGFPFCFSEPMTAHCPPRTAALLRYRDRRQIHGDNRQGESAPQTSHSTYMHYRYEESIGLISASRAFRVSCLFCARPPGRGKKLHTVRRTSCWIALSITQHQLHRAAFR